MPSAFEDLIVVIPGILGSKLVQRSSGRTVWDLSVPALLRVWRQVNSGTLALSDLPTWLEDPDVVATDLFSAQWVPDFFGVEDYNPLIQYLRGMASDRQVLKFPYDWRRSNAISAQKLSNFVHERLHEWRQASGAASPKVWLVCHSMGGLVARYFCDVLGGAAVTRALVTYGTPYLGSAKALTALAGLGPFARLQPLLQLFPSVHELLPRFPVIALSPDDHELYRLATCFGLDPATGSDISPAPADISSSDAIAALTRAIGRKALRNSLQFHNQIQQAVARRVEPAAYKTHVVFSDRHPTLSNVAMDRDKIVPSFDRPMRASEGGWSIESSRGDGTVPSFAALPPEWADSSEGVLVAQTHTRLPAGAGLHAQLANWIRPIDLAAYRGATLPPQLGLQAPEFVLTGEPLVVKTSSLSRGLGSVSICGLESGRRSVHRVEWAGNDSVVSREFGPLRPDAYELRATMDSPFAGMSVSNWVLVGDA